MMQLFIIRNGQREGPFSLEQIQSQVSVGSLRPIDLAWHKGLTDWVPLSQIAGLQLASFPQSSGSVRPGMVTTICVSYLILTAIPLLSLLMLPSNARLHFSFISYALLIILSLVKLTAAILLFQMRRASLFVFGALALYGLVSYARLFFLMPHMYIASGTGGLLVLLNGPVLLAINVAAFIYLLRLNKAGALR